MMEDILSGALGFFEVGAFVLLVMELSALLEELFSVRAELRKGFTGTKTSLIKIFSRHCLRLLRIEGGLRRHMGAGIKFALIFVSAGLLPLWDGRVTLSVNHSLWIFLGITLFGPVLHLVFAWLFNRGSGWPIVLTSAERAIGSATVLFILSITVVAMTGADRFADFQKSQEVHGWLVIRNPLAIPLLMAFSVVTLFSSFQTIFSRTGDEREEGWSFDDLLLPLRRSVWSVFMADVFLGGADFSGLGGGGILLVKCVSINVFSAIGAHLFFQLREDQAESFILWRLAPVSILILVLSLLLPGGVV